MVSNRQPSVGSGRAKEAGELATRKQDFNAHYQGNGFRHDATMIDMNPEVAGVGGDTVQQTLENLHAIVVASGTGFISIGSVSDGYDGYALGSYNVGDNSTPTLYDTFNAAFDDPRLVNGGIILLLAGTYTLHKTVHIPAGISVMGEIGGSLIIGEMPETSMFHINVGTKDIRIGGNSGGGTIQADVGHSLDSVRFFNLMLSDNLNGDAAFGQSSMQTVPMIAVENGSKFECDHVSFLGRLNSGAVSGRGKTKYAIESISGASTATHLTIRNCYFDGLRVGIKFAPAGVDGDNLIVQNCRARTYGSETGATPGKPVNCFIDTPGCAFDISNNYHIGAGSQVKTFLSISNYLVPPERRILIGNRGGPFSDSGSQLIFVETGLIEGYFDIVNTHNNWGTFRGNPWFITVGSSDGAAPLGDIWGEFAIDMIFDMANSNSTFDATVIVNPGTYSVTGQTVTFANLKFIGNKKGKTYPVFELDVISSSTDSLSNRFIVFGNHLESIIFKSVSNRSSVRPSFNPTSGTVQSTGGTILVKDCIFYNASLYPQNPSATPWTDGLGNPTSAKLEVVDCHFFQDGDFTDTFSAVLPEVEIVTLRDCFFNGSGYAFCIGTLGFSGGTASNSSINIENVTCDMVDKNTFENYTISATNPLVNCYINVSGVHNLKVDKLSVHVGNGFSVGSPNDTISTVLTNAGSVTKFINLAAEVVRVSDSMITGPQQTFRSGGIDYALPSMVVSGTASVSIKNSKFWVGALPLQIASSLGDTTFTDNIIVDGCGFQSGGRTAFDIDLALEAQDWQPQIVVSNCNFQGGGTSWPIKHNTFSFQNAATVGIYAGDADVKFYNNTITGYLDAWVGLTSTRYVGLYIDCYSNLGSTGDQFNAVTVYDNSIYVTNNFSVANVNAFAACAYILAPVINIHDNVFTMSNQTGAGTAFAGCLVIDNNDAALTGLAHCMVSGNFFNRRDIFGTETDLLRGYIKIQSSSVGNGHIINNSFDSDTYNGVSIALVEDNSSGGAKWNTSMNRGQEQNVVVYGDTGRVEMNAQFARSVSLVDPPSSTLTMTYTTGSTGSFTWYIPVDQMVPRGAYITSITFSISANQNSGTITADTWTARLQGHNITSVNGSPSIDFSSAYTANSTISVTLTPTNTSPTNTHINQGTSDPLKFFISVSGFSASTTTVISIQAPTIAYKM